MLKLSLVFCLLCPAVVCSGPMGRTSYHPITMSGSFKAGMVERGFHSYRTVSDDQYERSTRVAMFAVDFSFQ